MNIELLPELQREIEKCTNCGLCLSSCPTYRVTGREGDSPRGRINLLRMVGPDRVGDDEATRYLSGCIECGSCHASCPTGVHVADACRHHRSVERQVLPSGLSKRIDDLALLIGRDPGASLTISAITDLLSPPDDRGEGSPSVSHGYLPVFGPLLELIDAPLVARMKRALPSLHPDIVDDPALTRLLELASGLLTDVGLFNEHQETVEQIADHFDTEHESRLTIAVFDLSMRRLADLDLPRGIEVVSGYEVSSSAVPNGLAEQGVLDHMIDTLAPSLLDHPRMDLLPEHHHTADAPVIVSAEALDVTSRLVEEKRAWIAGRVLLTADAKAIARYPNSTHLGRVLVQSIDEGESVEQSSQNGREWDCRCR